MCRASNAKKVKLSKARIMLISKRHYRNVILLLLITLPACVMLSIVGFVVGLLILKIEGIDDVPPQMFVPS